jgi:hypothetical protein
MFEVTLSMAVIALAVRGAVLVKHVERQCPRHDFRQNPDRDVHVGTNCNHGGKPHNNRRRA